MMGFFFLSPFSPGGEGFKSKHKELINCYKLMDFAGSVHNISNKVSTQFHKMYRCNCLLHTILLNKTIKL